MTRPQAGCATRMATTMTRFRVPRPPTDSGVDRPLADATARTYDGMIAPKIARAPVTAIVHEGGWPNPAIERDDPDDIERLQGEGEENEEVDVPIEDPVEDVASIRCRALRTSHVTVDVVGEVGHDECPGRENPSVSEDQAGGGHPAHDEPEERNAISGHHPESRVAPQPVPTISSPCRRNGCHSM